jgi:hypothetical protein
MGITGWIILLFAQGVTIEPGSPSELRGITNIYIQTDVHAGTSNSAVQKHIRQEITKKLPALHITDKPEDAEIMLVFTGNWSTGFLRLTNAITSTGVVVKSLGPDRVRLLMNFTDARTGFLERRPSTNFARAFVKAYLEANR